jgi:hypothetical protein
VEPKPETDTPSGMAVRLSDERGADRRGEEDALVDVVDPIEKPKRVLRVDDVTFPPETPGPANEFRDVSGGPVRSRVYPPERFGVLARYGRPLHGLDSSRSCDGLAAQDPSRVTSEGLLSWAHPGVSPIQVVSKVAQREVLVVVGAPFNRAVLADSEPSSR